MKNKLAIFDMDGTLFDTKEANFIAYKTVLEDYDYNLEYEYFIKNCFGKHYKDFLNGIVDEKLFEEVHSKKKKLYKDYLIL